VGIGYETPWRQIQALLIEAAGRTPGLAHDPPPYVRQQALGDFAVTYTLFGFCKVPKEMFRIYSDLHGNILDLFNEHSVQIMTPAYEGDPEKPKVVPREEWFLPPAKAPAAPKA
jgi:small-conductance mechanosensitive channel